MPRMEMPMEWDEDYRAQRERIAPFERMVDAVFAIALTSLAPEDFDALWDLFRDD
jgi:hypothetical protein